ncbi:MAG: protein kinase [Myxococcota bacterium]
MTGCPAPEVLDAAARGELDPASRAALEQHVDGCPACAEVLAGLVHVYGSAMPSAPASGPVTVSDPGVAQAPSAPGPGATLGRFTIVRALGAGGMGVVYEAHDPSLQRRVALKLLHTDGAAHELRVQLLREARALARLAHPNVVGVHEVGEAGGRVFVAMEFIEGGTLRHWLRAGPTREAIVATFVAAGQGLAAAHAVGLVHRDFKPDNVLVGRDGRARVVDFGLARPLDASWATLGQTLVSGGTDGGLTTSVARTKPGSLVGTPAYMAPEQLRGERADAASDQFAFCVALYEALVGARPFAGSSLAMLATNVVEGRRPPTPSSVPSRLRAVLDRGLQPDPTRRFATMHALLRDLAPRKRGWVLPVAVTAGVLGAGVAAGVTWMVTRPDETQPPPVVVAPPSEPEADPVEPAPPTRAGLCGASLDATWSPGRRATVATALKGPLLQNETSMRATAALDAWQEDFAAERDAACEDAAKKDRLPCLSRQWARFDALATALGDADSIAANYAEIAVSSLEPARACRSTARRALEPAAAADARARARRTLKRAAIDDAWARGLLHRVDAEDAAQRAVADVAESEDFVVMAEASRVLGDVLAKVTCLDSFPTRMPRPTAVTLRENLCNRDMPVELD